MTSFLAAALSALRIAMVAAVCAMAVPVVAQEAAIRRNLADRLPTLPKPDEVSRTPVPGLWELRFGSEVIYTDDQGNYLITGTIMDTRNRRDLTAERIEQLTAIQFANLPFKDAIVTRYGNGSRRVAVFSDPNCTYCKRMERDIPKLKNATVYTFLYPILGKDSASRARQIWCATDPAKAWRDWMTEGRAPIQSVPRCDTAALDRNVELGRRHRIEGTPLTVFEDGTRRSGLVSLTEFERLLGQAGPGGGR